MPVTNHQNPGTTNPADQAYPAATNPSVRQSPSSSSTTNSNGEIQSPSNLTQQAVSLPGLGLSANVHAGSTSQVKSVAAVIADTRPPARDVSAGASRPGGLPINVLVR